MKHLENAKGVTLIALVTTIIVLLILIGVSCGVVSDMILIQKNFMEQTMVGL